MFKTTVNFFDRLMRTYTPDPFLLALMLTASLFVLGIAVTPSTAREMVSYWGDGFWNLIPFTLQMIMILVGGYIIAVAPPIKSFLQRVSRRVTTPAQGILLVSLSALFASAINWGLGLVIGGILCREVKQNVPTMNYRLLVASAYSGFIVWHGGLSASIPLVIASPGHFLENIMGGTIPLSQTLFSPLNLTALALIFIAFPVTNWLLLKTDTSHPTTPTFLHPEEQQQDQNNTALSPAQKLENSRLVSWVTALLGFSYIGFQIADKGFHPTLNDINFLFLFLAILFHQTPRSLIDAITEAAERVGPILLQFPFYAGIMGMMTASKLAELISTKFISLATPQTFSLLAFYSAGLVNLFIPSGGGQWAVQGPIMVDAAQKIGADLPQVAMAIAWGDAWTNLLQPFWALPLLAIAGLHLKDIMGYCVTLLLVSGVILSGVFIAF